MEAQTVSPTAGDTYVGSAIGMADKWILLASYLIDVMSAILLALVSLIPVVGIIFAGLLLTPYWLLVLALARHHRGKPLEAATWYENRAERWQRGLDKCEGNAESPPGCQSRLYVDPFPRLPARPPLQVQPFG
jgi:hypothetical protein